MEINERNLFTATNILNDALEDIFITEVELANDENPISQRARYLRYLKIIKKDTTATEKLIACYKPQADFFTTKKTARKDNEKAIKKESEFRYDYMTDIYTMLEDTTVEEVKAYRDDEDEAVYKKYSKHILELFGPDDVYQYIIDTKKSNKTDKIERGKDGKN